MATFYRISSARTCRGLAAWVCIFAWVGIASSHAAGEQRRRVYFLESLSPTQFAAIRTIEGFEARLREKTAEKFEIFIDYLEIGLVPRPAAGEPRRAFPCGKLPGAPPCSLAPAGWGRFPFPAGAARPRPAAGADHRCECAGPRVDPGPLPRPRRCRGSGV